MKLPVTLGLVELGIVALSLAASPALADDWNTHFGGIPNAGLITGEVGFSMVPKVAYHHPLSNSVTIGGAFAFDLGYYYPRGGTRFGIGLTAPIRISLADGAQWTTGLKLEPGFLFQFENRFAMALLLNAGFNAGYKVNSQFTIGPGVDIPLAFGLTPAFVFNFPILIGGALEFHPTQELAITFDMKFGPFIQASDFGSDAGFGMKIAAGVAYHL